MNQIEQIEHLEVMKNELAYSTPIERQNLERSLKSSRFIKSEAGKPEYVEHLIFPQNDFQEMVTNPNTKLNSELKKILNEKYLLKFFLQTLGMKSSLNTKDVLQYIDDHFVEKDMVLLHDRILNFMNHLVKDDAFKDEKFCKALASKRFLPRGYPKWAND